MPCGTSRKTVRHSDLPDRRGKATVPPHSPRACRWPGVCPPEDQRTGGRPELLGHARERTVPRDGMIALTGKGLSGKGMVRFAANQIRVLLVRLDRQDERRRFGNLAGMRQWIESVNDTLKDQLGLEQHGERRQAGVCARDTQRLLALAAVIWRNGTHQQPRQTLAHRLRPLTSNDRVGHRS